MKNLLLALTLTVPSLSFATSGFDTFIGQYVGVNNVTGHKCEVEVSDLEFDKRIIDRITGIRVIVKRDLMDFLPKKYGHNGTSLEELRNAVNSKSDITLRYTQSDPMNRKGYLKIENGVLKEVQVQSNFFGNDFRTTQCAELEKVN